MHSNNSNKIPRPSVPFSDKFIEKLLSRANFVENGFRNVRSSLMEYTLKHASLRNKSERLAKTLTQFAQDDEYNTTTRMVLTATSDVISAVGDCRSAYVNRLKENILPLLFSYDNTCKNLRANLLNAKKYHERADVKRKWFSKLEEKCCNNDVLKQAGKVLQKALKDETLSAISCSEAAEEFEHRRVQDTKKALEEFFTSEMAPEGEMRNVDGILFAALPVHAKALERYTDAYQQISHLNAEADIQVLRSSMTLRGIQPILEYKSKSEVRNKSSVLNSSKNAPTMLDNSGDDIQDVEDLSHPSPPLTQKRCDPACSDRARQVRHQRKLGHVKSCYNIRVANQSDSHVSTERSKCDSLDGVKRKKNRFSKYRIRAGTGISKNLSIWSRRRKNLQTSHVVSKYKYPEKQ